MTSFGIVGLGKIGSGLAEHARERGHDVVAFDRTGISEELKRLGVRSLPSLASFAHELRRPRIVFVYVPAGTPTEDVCNELAKTLERGDVLVDGGNSNWKDSVRRASTFAETGVHFLDMGTSGGLEGARRGACFMVGGDARAFEHVRPILVDLAESPQAVAHVGPAGAGHLAKLVHNGIEMGMVQALGEASRCSRSLVTSSTSLACSTCGPTAP